MAQIYEYQDIDAHVILLFVHPAQISKLESFNIKQRTCQNLARPLLLHSKGAPPTAMHLYHKWRKSELLFRYAFASLAVNSHAMAHGG